MHSQVLSLHCTIFPQMQITLLFSLIIKITHIYKNVDQTKIYNVKRI